MTVCQTNQLVNQVVETSIAKYGIKPLAFTGSRANYSQKNITAYRSAEAIAVTNYASVFNTNTFFDESDIIIFDDAHSAENYISENWSLRISKKNHNRLFLAIAEELKNVLDNVQYQKLIQKETSSEDIFWVDKLPMTHLLKKEHQLREIIEARKDINSIKYRWEFIRDHIYACNLFLKTDELLLRPYIPPTLTYKPFTHAVQRIYMSATLGESGELERTIGIENITRLSNKLSKFKSIGRRFFLFPGASLDKKEIREFITQANSLQERSLLLVENDRQVSNIKEVFNSEGINTYFSNDIEESKEDFIKDNNACAILANRYDGIDFEGDECHLLMLGSLPSATHLQERFFTTRMAASVLFTERVKTRIVQAVGRCTRSDIDYAAVIITGTQLESTLMSPKKLRNFDPELRAELEFGYEESKEQTLKSLIENLEVFFEQDDEWADIDEDIIQHRDQIVSSEDKSEKLEFKILKEIADYEVRFQYALWRRDYTESLYHVDHIKDVLSKNSNVISLTGYYGYWNYIAGCLALNLSANQKLYLKRAEAYFRDASKTTKSINWFHKLVEQDEDTTFKQQHVSSEVIEKIESNIQSFGNRNSNRFETHVDEILMRLQDTGEEFELGHKQLGELLGYISGNPSGDTDPDPYWIPNPDFCIVAEDKIYNDENKAIPTRHVTQAQGHKRWIKNTMRQDLRDNAEIVTIFVSNATTIEPKARLQAEGLYYVNKEELEALARRAIQVIRTARSTYNQPGDLEWREMLNDLLISEGVCPESIIKFFKNNKLDNLKLAKKKQK